VFVNVKSNNISLRVEARLGVKATTLKAKANDLASKAKAGRCQGECQYGLLFSQNFKTQTFIAGLVMK